MNLISLNSLKSKNFYDRHHVKAIFNLQEPGEHEKCGDGVKDMKIGFAYDPNTLQKHGISVYFFHWQDMTNPTIKELLVNC